MTSQDHYVPRSFWNAFKDYDGQRLNLREHQDAYEFFTRLQVEASAIFPFTKFARGQELVGAQQSAEVMLHEKNHKFPPVLLRLSCLHVA